jgi:hypothetical protein
VSGGFPTGSVLHLLSRGRFMRCSLSHIFHVISEGSSGVLQVQILLGADIEGM